MTARSTSPPAENLGPCQWTIPPAEDSPRGTKSTTCGKPGIAEVRIREKVDRRTVITDAKVILCHEHKVIHDERAAGVRVNNK